MNDKIILARKYAFSFIGTPYIWGGETPMRGFDCSGFVQEILRSVGLDPSGDQTAQALYDYLFHTGCEESDHPGSIVFFGHNLKQITHVGFLIHQDFMIEAGGGGPRTTTRQRAIEHRAFVRMRPIDSRRDFLSCLMPRY